MSKTLWSLFSDQDSVRLLAVEGCAALGKLLEPQDCVAHILPVIVNFSQVYIAPMLDPYILQQVICFLCLDILLEDMFVVARG
jgi:serine/threonine-protein phosphatase 2A regulatory subunit A